MDRGRRAERYGNATLWTREVARNLAHHLERISKAHSCVDTSSPKCAKLPQFQHKRQRNFVNSPLRATHKQQSTKAHNDVVDQAPVEAIDTSTEDPEPTNALDPHPKENNNHEEDDQPPEQRDLEDLTPPPPQEPQEHHHHHDKSPNAKRQIMDHERQEAIDQENRRLRHRLIEIAKKNDTTLLICSDGLNSFEEITSDRFKRSAYDSHRKREIKNARIWQENQLMLKRIRNAKPTIKSDEMVKDDKWNQSFQKSQERRRIALQQEMKRIQNSPQHAVVMHAKQLTRKNKLTKINRVVPVEELSLPITPMWDAERTPPRSPPAPVHAQTPLLDAEDSTQETSAATDSTVNENTSRRRRNQHRSRVVDASESTVESSSVVANQQVNELVSFRFTYSREQKHRNTTEETREEPPEKPERDEHVEKPSASFTQPPKQSESTTHEEPEPPHPVKPEAPDDATTIQTDASVAVTAKPTPPGFDTDPVQSPESTNQTEAHDNSSKPTSHESTNHESMSHESDDSDHPQDDNNNNSNVDQLTNATSTLTITTLVAPSTAKDLHETAQPTALMAAGGDRPIDDQPENSYEADEFDVEIVSKSPPKAKSSTPTVSSCSSSLENTPPQAAASTDDSTTAPIAQPAQPAPPAVPIAPPAPIAPTTPTATALEVHVTAEAQAPVEYENEFEEDEYEDDHEDEQDVHHSYSNDDFDM